MIAAILLAVITVALLSLITVLMTQPVQHELDEMRRENLSLKTELATIKDQRNTQQVQQ